MANPVDLAANAPWVSAKLYPPRMGLRVEIGWYDFQGDWQVHIAILNRDGWFMDTLGNRLADPDWWKETTPPPPK